MHKLQTCTNHKEDAMKNAYIRYIEDAILADVEMGLRDQIHHIWVRPDVARYLGLPYKGDFREGGHRHHGHFSVKGKGAMIHFWIEVSSNVPRSADQKNADRYAYATVDEFGWIVGERTNEELARRPARYQRRLVA